MLPWRVAWGYLLWRVGLRAVLPRHFIARVRITECGEALAALAPSPRLHLRPVAGAILLRVGVCERLQRAAELLPDGFSLVILEGFRSVDRQRELWERELATVRAAFPAATTEEVRRRTRLRIAEPGAHGANHQTGAAVDLTLGDGEGRPLDLGTAYDEFTPWTPMSVRGLPEEFRHRRRVLRRALEGAGFAFYPGEWWHFCYGDAMWAAYRRRPLAIYGPCGVEAEAETRA